ncbi:YjgN family protein [Cognatishimia sp. WU-CL00825]
MQVKSPWETAKVSDPGTSTATVVDTNPYDDTSTHFVGRRWRLFWMSFRLGILTVLTLGFYRFWMKTRLRRWYWSAWRPLGHPLEYVGDPWEKLLGFLIAVVILAFYVGIVNLLLMFASFALFNGNVAAYVLSFIGVIPLWFYARYRARRYVLARSRWRGVRFGLAPGAWGFAARAMWHWFLTLITLGLLWPRKAFYLEKYITDRTYYGAEVMQQGGKWIVLFRPWLAVWLPILIGAAFVTWLRWTSLYIDVAQLYLMIAFLIFWFIWAVLNYRVKSLAYLTSQKQIAGATLYMAPRRWKVAGIYFWGYLLACVSVTLLLIPMGLILFALVANFGEEFFEVAQSLESLPKAGLIAINIALYFLVFLTWTTFVHAFVRFPLLRHYAQSFALRSPEGLKQVRQRGRDEFSEAEGFAEALDVGAAI